MATPTKFTPERVAAILADVAAGRTIKHACARNGVADRNFRRWLDQGAKDLEADEDTEYARLWLRFECTRGDRIDVLQGTVLAGDASPATGARWLLERFDPQSFHLTTKTEVSGPEGGPIHVSDARDKLLALLARRAAGEGESGSGS